MSLIIKSYLKKLTKIEYSLNFKCALIYRQIYSWGKCLTTVSMEIETDLSSTLYQEIYSICEARFSFAVTRLAKILSLLQNLDSSNIFLLSTMLVLISFSFLVYRVPPSRRLKLQSAQLIKCRHQLALLMKEKSCSPLFLRLAWTDAATYDASIHEWPNSGGCTGSVHFEESLQHPANKGLDKAITMLNPFKQTYNLISWADLIQMAGSLAVEICGGPDLQNSMVGLHKMLICLCSSPLTTYIDIWTNRCIGASRSNDCCRFLSGSCRLFPTS